MTDSTEIRYKYVVEVDFTEKQYDRGQYVDTVTTRKTVEFSNEGFARSHIEIALKGKPKIYKNIRLYQIPTVWEELEI